MNQPSSTQALIRLLVYAQWNTETGREVVSELRTRGPEALADLKAALMDAAAPKVTRMVIASLLGEECGPGAEAALASATGDQDSDVADTARSALTHCEEDRGSMKGAHRPA